MTFKFQQKYKLNRVGPDLVFLAVIFSNKIAGPGYPPLAGFCQIIVFLNASFLLKYVLNPPYTNLRHSVGWSAANLISKPKKRLFN